MPHILAMYTKPVDPGVWDKYYLEKHIPLAKKLPGLRRIELSRGEVMTPMGPSPYHLVGSLHFDDMAALQAALVSSEGQAAAADAMSFMAEGSQLLVIDSVEV
jgi:uncharacterized protein (TIGR02118 family)